MKKLKLNLQQMKDVEMLSREQLKRILGGDNFGSGSGGSGSTNCSHKQCGGNWEGGASGHWVFGSCEYQSGIGNLPGGCFCNRGGQAC